MSTPDLNGDPVARLDLANVALETRVAELTRALADAQEQQAAIAIENTQLLRELEQRLEEQTATAEVLRVISESPTDLQKVLDTIARAAARLCAAGLGEIIQVQDGVARVAGRYGPLQGVPVGAGRRVDRSSLTGRAFLDRVTVHVPDIMALSEAEYFASRGVFLKYGNRSGLSVPLMRGDLAIGVISVRRAEAGPFSTQQIKLLETFADQAVIAISNAELFQQLQERNHSLSEALEQQTATSEILEVISRSPTDLTAVLETIVASAARLCEADDVNLYRRFGDRIRAVTSQGELAMMVVSFVETLDPDIGGPAGLVLDRGTPTGRAVLDRVIVHVPDVDSEPADRWPISLLGSQLFGNHTVLAAPLLREGQGIGAIAIYRREPRPFAERQINLLETFARQAVIAIENTQLFQELEQRLEEQTATAEVLRVISESPTELQKVLDTIAEAAARLCAAGLAEVWRVQDDGIRVAARFGVLRGVPVGALGPPSRASVTGRAILDRETIHVADITKVPEDEYPVSREAFRDHGNRSGLSVPLLREGSAIGAISVRRAEASPFSTQQIKLLETFADQAVIAISNAELFQKLQERNRNLTEALEQQTATSEVLKVISRSAFVLRPVLETLLENAVKLCGADGGAVHGPDGRAELTYGYSAEFRDLVLGKPFTPGRGTLTGRVMLERRAIHVSDVLADPDYEWTAGQHAGGYRTMLGIPMLHDEVIVGSFSLMRFRTEAFTDRQVELVSTFADQAVIAIENTRLIEELQQRLDEQTATSEILRVISQSPTDLPAVLETITASAARLCEADDVNLIRRFGDRIRTVTSHGDLARMVATWVGSLPPDIGGPAGLVLDRGTTTGRGILDREIVHVPNVEAESVEEFPIAHRAMPSLGVKTLLSAPLIRDDQGIGAITIYRRDVRPFTEKQIKLLETFASQAVIAISNTELFQQLEDRNRELGGALAQQTALSNVLKVISRSAFDLQPVLDTLAENATLLSRADYGYIMGLEGTVFTPVATFSQGPDQDQGLRYVREHPLALDRGSVTGRAGLERRPVQVEDVLTDADYTLTDVQRIGQYRSMLAVPLLRDDTLLGVIGLMRLEVRPFSAREVDLISTFADQAVIAIENSRLIEELQQRLEEQTANAEVLRVISESPTELQKVLDTIASAAARLCGTNHAQIYRVVPDGVNLIAHFGDGQDLPIGTVSPLSRGGVTHRAILESQTIHVPDILDLPEDEYPVTRPLAVEGGIRSHLAVPLLRGNFAIGAITVRRPLAAPFSDKQVKLLETFADQAVIAISNAELFQQLQDRSRELATSVEQLQAMFEVGQAVSSTLDLETVLRTIAARAVELSGVDGGIIYEMDERAGHLRLRTAYQIDPDLVTTLQETPLPIGEGASGRAVATRAPVQIPDTLAEGAYQGRLRELVLRSGFRALLAVPLLHEDRVIGSLVVNRTSPGEFAPDVVELVKTFASQSAIALQNARLFRELEEKSHELEVASQHKSEFLANMSHELRTPLNAIIGFSEVLIERMFGELNDKQADYLQDIVSSGRHLLLLINDILDLSKVEAGRMELENGLFSLTELLDGGLTMVRERASRHGVTLDLVVDPRIDLIEGDERKIKQVVFNLLSNAVKFTPDGGRVELVARLGDGETLVCVQDTGIGIALEEVERIFEEFHQAKQAASSEREGTGLGLTLARRFVELHGGRIWVESQIGAGSTFTFTLPLRQGVTRNGAGLTGGSIPVNPSLDELDDRPVVLVVEDDPSAANLLSLYLTGAGFQVALAADGDAGLELARRLRLGARADQLRRRPAAIALDIVLPRLDGWDFLARLKADAVLADIPVIVVSMLDERGKGFALGAAEYLVKPVGRDDLLAALRRVEVRAHSRTAQPKVLAIDDDPMALDLVEALLDPAGYVVLKAPGGREGIALARTELPAVIVLDLLMPDVDGFAVVEALGADPATASIPIVVLTSKTMTAADKARLNGRIAVLARKTEFDRERFVELIRRWSSAGKEAFHGR